MGYEEGEQQQLDELSVRRSLIKLCSGLPACPPAPLLQAGSMRSPLQYRVSRRLDLQSAPICPAHLRCKVLEFACHGERLGVRLEADALAGGCCQQGICRRGEHQCGAVTQVCHISIAVERFQRIRDHIILQRRRPDHRAAGGLQCSACTKTCSGTGGSGSSGSDEGGRSALAAHLALDLSPKLLLCGLPQRGQAAKRQWHEHLATPRQHQATVRLLHGVLIDLNLLGG